VFYSLHMPDEVGLSGGRRRSRGSAWQALATAGIVGKAVYAARRPSGCQLPSLRRDQETARRGQRNAVAGPPDVAPSASSTLVVTDDDIDIFDPAQARTPPPRPTGCSPPRATSSWFEGAPRLPSRPERAAAGGQRAPLAPLTAQMGRLTPPFREGSDLERSTMANRLTRLRTLGAGKRNAPAPGSATSAPRRLAAEIRSPPRCNRATLPIFCNSSTTLPHRDHRPRAGTILREADRLDAR